MSTLSLRETDEISTEADHLCQLIEAHHDPLRSCGLGRQFQVEDARFRLIQFHDRNTLYRIELKTSWYLKLPVGRSNSMLEREIFGAAMVRAALPEATDYLHPRAVRVSTEDAYILSAEIPGRTLNQAFYRSSLASVFGQTEGLRSRFSRLGSVLATLHHNHPPERLASGEVLRTNRDAFESLRLVSERSSHSLPLAGAIDRWAEAYRDEAHEAVVVHGNLKPENILTSGSRVSLIDFENAGLGSPYQDLSLFVSTLALTLTLPVYPSAATRTALTAFVQGYRQVAQFDPRLLLDFITMRTCHYYLESFDLGNGRPRIAGLPVVRKKLENLIQLLIAGDSTRIDQVLAMSD